MSICPRCEFIQCVCKSRFLHWGVDFDLYDVIIHYGDGKIRFTTNQSLLYDDPRVKRSYTMSLFARDNREKVTPWPTR